MANPRNTISFEGIRDESHDVTFLIDDSTITFSATVAGGSSQVGLAVTLSDDKTVALTADGDGVLGKLILVERDGKCTVQCGGFMELPAGTGASLTNMKKIVGALLVAAKGYIREVATGTAAELGKARGAIIDNSTTTAVVVRLD